MTLLNKVINASLWSSIAEISAKVVTPLVFIVLTRFLLPSDFGVIAVATNILGFIYIVADLGVSKVIIQLNKEGDEESKTYDVAFLINLTMGIVLFLLMFLFSGKIAEWYNVPEADNVIKVMSFQVLFFSMNSVQTAIKKKELNYRFLFYIRLLTVVVPAVISIPFAFMGYGYWAIVLGSTFGSLVSTIILWIYTDWKPKMYWSKILYREIIQKSIWSSLEQILVWFPMFLDTFLISNYLSKRDLGLFTTSKTLFVTAIGVFLSPIIPVLYSSLSIKNRDSIDLYNKILIFAQKNIFIIASFLGISVFFFRDVIERIVFNNKWDGISSIFGIMFLIMCFEYFFSVLSEGLRGMGYFREVSINTFIAIFCTSISLITSIQYGLITYVIVRSLSLYFYLPGILWLCNQKLHIRVLDLLIKNKNILILNILCLIIYFTFVSMIRSEELNLIARVVLILSLLLGVVITEKKTIRFLLDKILKR